MATGTSVAPFPCLSVTVLLVVPSGRLHAIFLSPRKKESRLSTFPPHFYTLSFLTKCLPLSLSPPIRKTVDFSCLCAKFTWAVALINPNVFSMLLCWKNRVYAMPLFCHLPAADLSYLCMFTYLLQSPISMLKKKKKKCTCHCERASSWKRMVQMGNRAKQIFFPLN